MAITLASVSDVSIGEQATVLAAVGIGITLLVYGAVALIVKADDAGYALARTGSPMLRGLGRGLVKAMPPLLKTLAGVGTAAMLWVGGGIIIHGLEEYGVAEPGHSLHHFAASLNTGGGGGVLEWLVNAAGAGLFGLVIGGVIVAALHLRPGKTAQ